jgi:tetratricopeptide (TPR) repeat protein
MMIGALLNNRYRLDSELGRGGMGVVYRAHDTLLDRDVAVKLLSAAVLTAESRARLLREARSAAQLNHPNIVSVYDAGEADLPDGERAIPFVVMELVEGPSLHERRPTGLDEILAIAGQVCAALEHAHTRGIVHRDLKPENVLLAPTTGLAPLSGLAPGSIAKLSDFGLARSMASRMTTEGTIVGTVFYLAPELALGKEFDGRADLYALGVMLYELLTGDLPFVAGDPIAVISQHLHAPVVPPRAKRPGIPPGLDALVVRLVSKQPKDRPASAAEVQASLARLAAGETVEAVPGMAGQPALLDRIVRGRLVAREQELAEVRALWKRAAGGEGQVLLISGEPGIGKTRLVRELLTQVQVSGAWGLLGECYAEGGAPYAPFAQIVVRALGDGSGDGLDLPGFVLADLVALAPALRLRFPDLPVNPPLEPQAEQQRLFENMAAFCATLAARAPILLVVEDAHWADSGSLALLRHLARRTRRQPILIVATYREVELDETRPFHELLVDLNRERLATRLKLARLSPEGTRDLLSSLFAEEITPDFLQGIYRETEGNPFFVEEVCKALVESGKLAFAGGSWQRPSVEKLGIPQSVRMAIQSRVSRLPLAVQEMLQLAAILGREFEFEVLAGASELDEEGLIEALEIAEHAQLVEELAGRKEVAFAFAHALIPVTLAEEVHTLRRRRLHRRAAAAIEQVRPDDYEALAHHWAAAGDEERALTYCTRAGERALAAYANVEAEGYFRAALELAEGAAAVRADLLSGLGQALARQSRYLEAIEVWKDAIGLYRSLGDQDATSRLYARSARAAWYAGDTPRGLAICREGMALAGAPDSSGLADLIHETARACHFNGLSGEAESLSRQALEMAERLGVVRVQAEALTTLGLLASQSTEEALAALNRAVELAESAGLLAEASRAHHNMATMLVEKQGQLVAARRHFGRAAELSRQTGAVAEEIFSRNQAVEIGLIEGDLAFAEQEIAAVRRLLELTPDPGLVALSLHKAETLLQRYRGELEPAVEQGMSLCDQARAAGDLQFLLGFLSDLGESLLELGREAEAEAALQEAASLEDRLEVGTSSLFGMVVYRAKQGQIEAARQLLASVRARLAGRTLSLVGVVQMDWAEANLQAAEKHWPEAWASFAHVLDQITRAGARWYRAQVLRDWAEAHLARGGAGDAGRARELLRQAMAEYEAMDAPIYVGRVQQQLAKLGA